MQIVTSHMPLDFILHFMFSLLLLTVNYWLLTVSIIKTRDALISFVLFNLSTRTYFLVLSGIYNSTDTDTKMRLLSCAAVNNVFVLNCMPKMVLHSNTSIESYIRAWGWPNKVRKAVSVKIRTKCLKEHHTVTVDPWSVHLRAQCLQYRINFIIKCYLYCKKMLLSLLLIFLQSTVYLPFFDHLLWNTVHPDRYNCHVTSSISQ